MTVTLPTFEYVHEGVTYTAEHAVVSAFSLGREGHGLFTASLTFSFGGAEQMLGHYALENELGGRFIAALVDRLGTPWRGIGVKAPVVVFRVGSSRFSQIEGFAIIKGAQLGEPFWPKELLDG